MRTQMFILLICGMSLHAICQDSLESFSFFKDLSDVPESYEANTVAMRMIDGLGFRFYWGTDALSEDDYSFAASEETRSIGATLDHIAGLSNVILNATYGRPNTSTDLSELTYSQKREFILDNLYQARMKLSESTNADMESMDVIFKRGNSERRYDFWFAINGPISDAIWHVGQIVGYRRMAGNPFNSKVSVLSGTVRP